MNYRVHPAIKICVAALHRGAVIAYPTEAVWGLGCDPWNQHAVQRILQLKKRHIDKGLIIVAANTAQIAWLLEGLDSNQHQQLLETWPGPNTWLVPHHNRLPRCVHGVHDTIAVRVSAHPVVKALCEGFGGPIVSTSANPQALKPARSSTDVRRYFGKRVEYAAGRIGASASPSVIRDLRTGRVIRA